MDHDEPAEGSPSNDDENARNRKPRMTRTPVERLAAVQEKNRRAQKRFRERQKVRVQAFPLVPRSSTVSNAVTKAMS